MDEKLLNKRINQVAHRFFLRKQDNLVDALSEKLAEDLEQELKNYDGHFDSKLKAEQILKKIINSFDV